MLDLNIDVSIDSFESHDTAWGNFGSRGAIGNMMSISLTW